MRWLNRIGTGVGLCCCVAVFGCTDKTTGSTAEGSGTTGDTTADTSGPDTTAETGEENKTLARGISIDYVEANQGIGVFIGLNGQEVGPTDRVTFLLKDRDMLVRAFWTIPEDWQPREIEAVLTLYHASGESETLSTVVLVEEAAFEGDLSLSFFWGVLAAQNQPGLKYSVELYETEPGFEDIPVSDPPPRMPWDGSAFVGIEDSYQVMRTVVVPFDYNVANCQRSPDTSEETMQQFQDYMFSMNPIDSLEFTLHAPVQWNTEVTSFGQLNNYLSDLRFEEGAGPDVYYYGLIDACTGGIGGAGGQAHGIPNEPTKGLAYQRVSSGLSLDPDWSADTFVHEVGHSQGRAHVACNGDEGGPDPSYPHAGGDIGEWGFGIIDFVLRHPTFYKDYMTYCHPAWVSTWGWSKVYPIIKELSSWDFEGGRGQDPYDGKSLLVGSIFPDGTETWRTVPGYLPAFEPAQQVELSTDAGTVTQPAHVTKAADGDVTQIAVPLPDELGKISGLVRIDGSKRIEIDVSKLRVNHIR